MAEASVNSEIAQGQTRQEWLRSCASAFDAPGAAVIIAQKKDIDLQGESAEISMSHAARLHIEEQLDAARGLLESIKKDLIGLNMQFVVQTGKWPKEESLSDLPEADRRLVAFSLYASLQVTHSNTEENLSERGQRRRNISSEAGFSTVPNPPIATAIDQLNESCHPVNRADSDLKEKVSGLDSKLTQKLASLAGMDEQKFVSQAKKRS